MRFRRSGNNWEGRAWHLTPALDQLAELIEDAWPDRHLADGTVASKQHDASSPTSDHRPYPYNGPGVVFALDMGETVEDQGQRLAEQLRASKDPRIKYVIHEDRIFSSYTNGARMAWQWGAYKGGNEHLDHVHISVYRTAKPGAWNINLGDDMAIDAKYHETLEQIANAVQSRDSHGAAFAFLIDDARKDIVTKDELTAAIAASNQSLRTRLEDWVRDHVKTSIAAAFTTGAVGAQIDYGELVRQIGQTLAGG